MEHEKKPPIPIQRRPGPHSDGDVRADGSAVSTTPVSNEAFEQQCRVLATSAGALVGAATVNAAAYVVLIVPADGGGLSFSTNLDPEGVVENLRNAADVFEAEAKKGPGIWTPRGDNS